MTYHEEDGGEEEEPLDDASYDSEIPEDQLVCVD